MQKLKKGMNKFKVLFICMTMLLALLPITSYAQGEPVVEPGAPTETVAEPAGSGTAGDPTGDPAGTAKKKLELMKL